MRRSSSFEVTVAVLGLILTLASVMASFAQYKAANLQARAAVVALMPQIEVRSLLEKVDSDQYTDRRIEIASEGGPIYNFETDRLTWISVENEGKPVLRQLLVGYLFAAFNTGKNKGELQTIKGHKNHQRFVDFYDAVHGSLKPGLTLSEPVTLLKISYVDALENAATEYFLIRGGSTLRLSAEDGRKTWDEVKTVTDKKVALDFEKLSLPSDARIWANNHSVGRQ